MKIVSKFKDYFDYLQGVYGIDSKVVYDRRWENEPMFTLDDVFCSSITPTSVILSICDVYYVLFIPQR